MPGLQPRGRAADAATQAERLAEVVEALRDIATAGLDLNALMTRIVERAQHVTRAGGAAIELADADAMVYAVASGSLAPHVGLRLGLDGSLSGRCVRTGAILRCDDTETDPRVDHEVVRRVGLRSMIVVPLRHEDEVVGVLKVGSPRPWSFGEDDVETLAMMASVIAAAMANAARFAALNDPRDAFLTGISHELRTPLTSILGFAETLRRHEGKLSPDQRRESLERLAANAERLDALIEDLLDLDGLARGVVAAQRRPTDVAALVRRVVERTDVGDHPLHLDLEPVTAAVDTTKTERLVEALLANAVGHTPGATPVWVSVRAGDGGILLIVEDAGPGVPEPMRSTVFEPFRQGPEIPRHAPGLGVGLSLVRHVAELHGGRAWVEERPGGGASFRVLLATP